MVNGGLDWKRFDQVLAVLIKHGRMKLYNQDARVNVLGGAPAMEPAADAAMAAAIISSFYDVQMPSDIAFVGEVDLGGAPPARTALPIDQPCLENASQRNVLACRCKARVDVAVGLQAICGRCAELRSAWRRQ